ncbi:MAG: hypothetical protein NVSMB23_28160 [Myxococcales bacterium]
MEPIPDGEQRPEVGVHLAGDHGVVDAVHARRDEQEAQRPVEGERQPHVRMVELRGDEQRGLPGEERRDVDPDDRDLQRTEGHREQQLARVEPQGGGRVEVLVQVMGRVEPPEERNAVVREVPGPEAVIEQDDPHADAQPARQAEPTQETEPLAVGLRQGAEDDGPIGERKRGASQRGDRQVDPQAAPLRSGGDPEGPQPLGDEQPSQRRRTDDEAKDRRFEPGHAFPCRDATKPGGHLRRNTSKRLE